MPHDTRIITEADILPLAEWAGVRVAHRKALSARKKNRRVAIGPHATLYFENWDTMWYQVQEMLWIEKGGAEQLPDELAAYNPMIPQGSDLSATLMFGISDELKRRTILAQLGDHHAGATALCLGKGGDVGKGRLLTLDVGTTMEGSEQEGQVHSRGAGVDDAGLVVHREECCGHAPNVGAPSRSPSSRFTRCTFPVSNTRSITSTTVTSAPSVR